MRKYLVTLCVSLLLAGCAATEFKSARSNANLVKNGMTVEQAIALIGMSPTNRTGTLLEWRRGNAQRYNATPNGAINFHVRDGVIVDVPDGGIFGDEARRIYNETWASEHARQQALEAKAAAEARTKREAELEAAAQAAADAKVICDLKSTCAKVFSLAQIYIATETDQKIQVVTDSVIQTYNPTEIGNVGASIFKMPQRGDIASVTLNLSCKSNGTKQAEDLCRSKSTILYSGFRPFIEKRLAQ